MRRSGRPARREPRALRLWAGLLALALAACAREEAPAPARPPVVLVVLDTVRADHLRLYGYAAATSPALEDFARRADLYERAWATAPWTIPSHASLFTGLPPFAHRAHTYPVEEKRLNAAPLPDSAATLAEFLQGIGYRTGGFVANHAFLAPRFQLDQGFETWVVDPVPGVELARAVARWLDAAPAPGQPFLLFVNTMDAHRPYNVAPVPGLPPAPPDDPATLLDALLEQVMGGEAPIDADLQRRVIAQYDHGVANADRAFGDLVRLLEARGLFESALVIVTSDHGEYFGEHRLVEHSKDVYEPALRVPLLVKRPGQREGRRLPEPISIADVPALVLAELPGFAGAAPRPFRAQRGSRPILAENHFSRSKDLFHPVFGPRFRRVRAVLYEWPYKYIRSSDGYDELYELSADPGETRDLRESQSERALAMRARLDALVPRTVAPDPPAEALELGDEEREAMRALGYIE